MRRAKIIEAISEGYDTAAEISAHTGISDASVRRILIQLISQNRVRSAKTKNTNNRIELRFELASVLS
jgi:DNA-binding IclR family transcriptional regulator